RKRFTRVQPTQQPRWHNQSYMLFLALRQHHESSMARTDLIKSALTLDKKISEERSLPRVFRGKTPMNSASAILTNNSDRYFIPFKPEGSRSMHFRLSFEPGNFDSAFHEYTTWQDQLMQDWTHYFQHHKRAKLVQDLQVNQEETYATEFDEFIAKRKKAREYNSDTPRTWHDLLSIQNGVIAKQHLPKHTPLGFYFGVPMTEDEFDSLKDGLGKASEMAIMYRKTVIDPTNSEGNLYFHPTGEPLCPFHCIEETPIRENVNIAFYEGDTVNQIVCWTKREIEKGEQLFVY
ncbi:uncharacterized protein B0P05DRAFT_457786, partial [Gilbertella persicaria]